MRDRKRPTPTRQRRFALTIVTVVTLSLVVSGCAPGVHVSEVGENAIFIDSGFLTGDQAAINGTLTVTTAACIGIASSGKTYPAVWPRGTKLRAEDPVAIEIPGIGVKQLGDTIEGAGGFYTIDRFDALREVATRCEWSGEVIGVRFG